MGEKGPPRPILTRAHPGTSEAAGYHVLPGLPLPSGAGTLGGAGPLLGVGNTMAGICLSLGDEPYPSSLNTCALFIILHLIAEFTITPILQSDKLRLGEGRW